MNKTLIIILSVFLTAGAILAQETSVKTDIGEITWIQHQVDGHRTGVKQMGAGMTTESMGRVRKITKRYNAPNGRKFGRGVTGKVARITINAQDSMSNVKQIIGYSPRPMRKRRPQSALSNWYVDVVIDRVSEAMGKPVDIGFVNYGGLRTDMAEGEIFRDDIMSMFPFHNKLYYFTLTGKSLLQIATHLVEDRMEIFGGMELHITQDHHLAKVTVKGEPLDENKVYSVATIDFLMDGVGWFRFGQYAIDRHDTQIDLQETMLKSVENLTLQGKQIEYRTDNRVIEL